jgi:asparagine synthase (glutamine-hydrolysing)
MTFLAGWADTGIQDRAAQELCADIAAYGSKAVRINVTPRVNAFVACAAAAHQIVEHEHCLLAAVGAARCVDSNRLQDIIAAYKKYGDAFMEKLGDYGFALLLADIPQRKLILATDPIGQRHLYYSQTASGLVFGSSADAVMAHPDVTCEISAQSIYDYVYFHHCPSPNTIYRRVNKLEGGQMLVYQAGKVNLRRYWLPQFQERLDGNVAEAGKRLQHILRDSVRRLTADIDRTGAFLSGGLDSSSVAGALAQVYPGKARTFTIGFDAKGYDEIEYARIAARHFNTEQNEYYVTPDDVVKAVSEIAAYYDEPFGNSSALAAYYCAKMAREKGIEVLLAGDGGDELFAGNERYAKQLIFEPYRQLPGAVQNLAKAGIFRASDSILKNRLFFKAKRYIEQAETALPDRLQDYNFLHRHKADEIFTEDFARQVDTALPLQGLRESYRRPEHASALNRMLYLDWKTTLHDNDLVKVNKMCEMAGIEVQYPLLGHAVVEFSCQIPSALKLKHLKLRWFYKQAMRGFLPDKILRKSKHGFGLPFGVWLKDHRQLKELAYDSLNSLKKRDYFRPDFLDHAITMHQSIHAAYYGELIWVLMMLELWFNAKKI